jgi:hypothetical protein
LTEFVNEKRGEQVKDLAYWKANAEEDYVKTPISVLRYIMELEKERQLAKQAALAFKHRIHLLNTLLYE